MQFDPRALIRPWLIPLSVCLVIGLLTGGGWWYLAWQQTDTLAKFVPASSSVYLHFSFPHQRQGEHSPVAPLAEAVIDTLAETLFADLPGILADEHGQPAFNRELAVVLTKDHHWFALVRVTKQQAAAEYYKNTSRFVAPRVLLAGDAAIIDQLNTSTHQTSSLATANRQSLTLPAPFLTGQANPTALVPANTADQLKNLLRSIGTNVKLRIDWAGRSFVATNSSSTTAFAPLLITSLPPQTALTITSTNPIAALTQLPHGQLSTWAAIAKAAKWSATQANWWQRPMQLVLTRPTPSTIGWTVIMPRLTNETIDTLQTNITPLLAARYPTFRRHTLPDGSTSQELVPPTANIASAPVFNTGRKLTTPNGSKWYLAAADSFFFFGDDSAAVEYLLAPDQLRPTACSNQTTPGMAVSLSELAQTLPKQLLFIGAGDTKLLSGCIGSPQ